MTKKADYKKKYDMARHHAWAGSVLLAILGATRWFVQDVTYQYKDLLFIIAGIVIIMYILIALFFTYQFRSGLITVQKNNDQQVIINQSNSLPNEYAELSPKEQEKIEKKRAKNESKQLKKIAKAKEKEEKKFS